MEKFKNFLQVIEAQKQNLEAFIRVKGYVENLGQSEYREFKDKVNGYEELTFAEKADLCGRFVEMLNNL